MSFEDKGTGAAGRKIVNLALQGGGSHGAFTWGVLDRLLEDERLSFEGISGTSAGAVNAVVMTDGLAAGGRQAAKDALRAYWQKVAALSSRGVFTPSPFDKANPDFGLEHSPGYLFMESLTYFMSPYQVNPLKFNPLRDLLAESINFERVRRQQAVKLFISATNVKTAKVKVFNGKELDVQHVLASTCLPLMMHAVEVDGQYYWDGSFTGNPAIFPLLFECESPDIVMVHITPADRPEVPTTSPAIMNRMQEISFNTSLIREMRTIAYLTRLIDAGKADGAKRLLIHLIEAEDLIRKLSWSSRLNGDWNFLTHLHGLGRARADKWLAANFDRVGVETTINLEEKYF
ncbi:MAG: patatin-like phospholipase family protein [Xanthobacteraceae bacterium]|nr:patatin-like phospholipase family protein [Xanthobacteraceae bacterium]